MHPLYNDDATQARQIRIRRQKAAIAARQKLLAQLIAENERITQRIAEVRAELKQITPKETP